MQVDLSVFSVRLKEEDRTHRIKGISVEHRQRRNINRGRVYWVPYGGGGGRDLLYCTLTEM